MQPATEDVRTFLATRIQEHLRQVEGKAARLRRVNLRAQTVNLALTTLATLLAGLTAAGGPLVGEGPPAWRWSCGAIAVATAAAGLVAGLHQRLEVPERLARVLSCAGRLRSLGLALQLARLSPAEVGHEYEQLVASYPEELT